MILNKCKMLSHTHLLPFFLLNTLHYTYYTIKANHNMNKKKQNNRLFHEKYNNFNFYYFKHTIIHTKKLLKSNNVIVISKYGSGVVDDDALYLGIVLIS